MTDTRVLKPWEMTRPTDVFNGKPIGDTLHYKQAAGYAGPVTRRLTVTLDIEDALAIANRLPLENLPHCGKPLHDLVEEARRVGDVT